MHLYEVIFVVRPDVPEEEREKLVAQMEKVAAGSEGTVQKVEKMGLRRLAYRVSRYREGFYVLFKMGGSGNTVREFERRLKVTDAVIKYLTIRVDEELKRAAKDKELRVKAEARRARPKPKPSAQPQAPAAEAAEA